MSITLPALGGTLTGGASAVLTPTSREGGKVTYKTAASSRLAPRTVDFLTSATKVTAADPGVARAQLRVGFANRTVSESCCDTQMGTIGFDVNFRWHLNQPQALVTEALEYLQSLVFSPEFEAMLISGNLPD